MLKIIISQSFYSILNIFFWFFVPSKNQSLILKNILSYIFSKFHYAFSFQLLNLLFILWFTNT